MSTQVQLRLSWHAVCLTRSTDFPAAVTSSGLHFSWQTKMWWHLLSPLLTFAGFHFFFSYAQSIDQSVHSRSTMLGAVDDHSRAFVQALLPEKRYLFYPNLAKAAGSAPLARRIQALQPDIHIFGHTHFSWDTQLHGASPCCGNARILAVARCNFAVSWCTFLL